MQHVVSKSRPVQVLQGLTLRRSTVLKAGQHQKLTFAVIADSGWVGSCEAWVGACKDDADCRLPDIKKANPFS